MEWFGSENYYLELRAISFSANPNAIKNIMELAAECG